LHPTEAQKLAQLQQGQTPEERQNLADAACYLVQCAAQLSSNDATQAAALASQQRGAGDVTEQNELQATGLFVYNPIYDTANDLLNKGTDAALQELNSAGRRAANLGNQFLNKMQAGAQGIMNEPAAQQIARGANNGFTAVSVAGGGEPPSPGTAGVAVSSTSTTTGVEPQIPVAGTPVTSSGGSGDDTGSGATGQGARPDAGSATASNGATDSATQTPFQRGLQFQGDALSALGVPENTQRISVTLPDGTFFTVVPDALDGSTIVEVKDVTNLSNSNQFRGYLATGNPVQLIVSPNTQTISQPLQNLITSSGGSIRVFNSATGTFSPWISK
jgi:hypothetical protein